MEKSEAAAGGTTLTTGIHTSDNGEFTRAVPLLRFASLAFALLALILLVTDKETESVPVALPGMSKPLYLIKSASFVDVMGLKYYAGALAVVIAYSFFQGIFFIVKLLTGRTVVRSKALGWLTFVADQLVAYFIAGVVAVATELAFLAEHGAAKVGWNETCSQFGHFCVVYGIAVVISYLAALNVFAMAAISAYQLFRQYGPVQSDYGNRKQIHI